MKARTAAEYGRESLAAARAIQARGVFPSAERVREAMGGGDLDRIRAALKSLKSAGRLRVTVTQKRTPRPPHLPPAPTGPPPPDIEERIADHRARIEAEEAAWLARQGAADERLAAECRAAVLRFEANNRPSRARSG